MNVVLNGQSVEITASDIASLLRERGVDPLANGVAVAVNDEVVTRSRWDTVLLQEGDRIEVISAMQGG